MAATRLLVVLSSDPAGPVVRHRWRPFAPALAEAGIVVEVVPWAKDLAARRHAFHRAETADALVVSSRLLRVRDTRALRRRVPRLALDVDDALWLRDSARGASPSATRAWRWRGLVGAAEVVFAGNEYIAAHARRADVVVEVLPTVVAVDGEDGPTLAPTPIVLGWIGARATLPYLERIGPELSDLPCRVRVIADAAPSMPEGVTVDAVPWTENGWREALASCHIGLAPLPDDPWTRGKCGLKVLQMMSVGRPVVASAVGVQTEQVMDGETGLLVRPDEAFSGALRTLISDAALRERMGVRARDVVRSQWSVDAWAPRVVAAVERWLA